MNPHLSSSPKPPPYRYSVRLFLEMAPFLGQALSRYPKAIVFSPGALSPLTFTRRFREAVYAKKHYHYRHAAVPDDLFEQYADSLIISPRGDEVIIGTREAIKELDGSQAPSALAKDPPSEIFIVPSHLAMLASVMHIFSPRPTNFCVRNADPNLLKIMENSYDIGFDQDDNDPTKHHIL